MSAEHHEAVDAEDLGGFYVWDLRGWDGEIETLEAINEAWVAAHRPAEKVGTISVFPESVVLDDGFQDFVAEGWNEAAETTGLQYLAIVADGIKKWAVRNEIDAPGLEVNAFDEVEAAVAWMDEQVA